MGALQRGAGRDGWPEHGWRGHHRPPRRHGSAHPFAPPTALAAFARYPAAAAPADVLRFAASEYDRAKFHWRDRARNALQPRHQRVARPDLRGPRESIAFINAPLLARDDDEYLEVFEPDGAWERWQEVPDFRDSREDDEHYVIDGVSGHLTFGPAVREPDGLEHVYGRTPVRGSALRFVRYRFGGGVIGNVGANTLTVLKSSIPYVATVTNRRPAAGGLNPETLDAARLRAPMMIKTRDRAITAADFEFLAKEASRRVARARCIQVRADGAGSSVPPGTIELLIVPLVPPDHARTIESLQPPPELLEGSAPVPG
ncbi:MAG: putative baseplate assembly protein [Dehalococcoidia bacterium]|nr:putative baseplate assembly protein [Dehalococcoidia bacterium]